MAREQEEALLRITARYVAEVQAGQQPHLSDYLARYPQYASAIADFVAYYHAVEMYVPAGMDAATSLSDISREVLRRFQARARLQPEQRGNLLPLANGRSFTLEELADRLNLSLDIMIQLEQRMIEPATIPYELCKRLAAALEQPVSVVQEYFQADDQSRQGVGSRAKPSLWVAEEQACYPGSTQRPGFRQVLKASLLISAEQAADWEAILAREML
ncbi:MAG TPA: hypothetical protein VFB60_08515 [Ktedonobacteraceae bacterium]|nr:hypothetical protein [Ktedonobacteraceae bacterium]